MLDALQDTVQERVVGAADGKNAIIADAQGSDAIKGTVDQHSAAVFVPKEIESLR
jgi:hypothetical protein